MNEVRQALLTKAENYHKRLLALRGYLQDEGMDAIDPGHQAGVNDIKFNIASIEQLLASLPDSEAVRRVVVCIDPETKEEAAFAVVTSGRGGIDLKVREWDIQTLSCNAPATASLMGCRIGDDTALGHVTALDLT